MVAPLLILFLVSSILASATSAPPKLELEEPPVVFGTIHGSPIIAVFHGQSDIIKDDLQSKDTEDDPLGKMGPLLA
ncbi:hypothetical protein ANCCEY_06550 [Ancylostoma ceylanicum]|uniref:Uncharacterized protein n=2 Tax=Ancylostoma ceylanicum TaxID=53326 RepID=A0A0D6LWA9_9BILA|nr:hypothetical protein ANCCEY_06550 [Ancylostoma ceylanicum]EYB91174.1 hypothetical protein Y032_0209g2095 [Ancylostoma ceylanicum]